MFLTFLFHFIVIIIRVD